MTLKAVLKELEHHEMTQKLTAVAEQVNGIAEHVNSLIDNLIKLRDSAPNPMDKNKLRRVNRRLEWAVGNLNSALDITKETK